MQPFTNPQQTHVREPVGPQGHAPETQKIPETPIEIDDNADQWVEYYKSLGDQIKELDEKRKDARDQILQLAHADVKTTLKHGGKTVATITPQKSTKLNTTALKEKEPEIYEQFAYESVSLVLRVK